MSDHGNGDSLVSVMKWGCLASALVGVPLFCFLLLRDALGDCAPDAICEKGFITQVFVPSALSAVVSGMLVYGVVELIRKMRS